MEADEAGNNITDDSYLGVISNDTIPENTAAIIDMIINIFRFDQIYEIKSVESKLKRCLCFPMVVNVFIVK
jgi:hypothetical protein